jgi:hypothetical protein
MYSSKSGDDKMKFKTLEDKVKVERSKEEIIKEFIEEHTIWQIFAFGVFKKEKDARRRAEFLESDGFTVVLSRRFC